jgi:hypothetical protein
MRHANGDKIIVSRAADGHYVYYSVRDGRDNGTIIDLLEHRKSWSREQSREFPARHGVPREFGPESGTGALRLDAGCPLPSLSRKRAVHSGAHASILAVRWKDQNGQPFQRGVRSLGLRRPVRLRAQEQKLHGLRFGWHQGPLAKQDDRRGQPSASTELQRWSAARTVRRSRNITCLQPVGVTAVPDGELRAPYFMEWTWYRTPEGSTIIRPRMLSAMPSGEPPAWLRSATGTPCENRTWKWPSF